jgi:KDO2-lipid IV(A) lauroyltransferase
VRRGYYEVDLQVIAEPPHAEGAGLEIAESYARLLEASIRAAPADWLWIHNKWKYPKPADGADDARARRRG